MSAREKADSLDLCNLYRDYLSAFERFAQMSHYSEVALLRYVTFFLSCHNFSLCFCGQRIALYSSWISNTTGHVT